MATDYRFAVRCWQDSAGSENARLDVFIGDTKVVDNVEVIATSADSPQVVYWESTGLADPAVDGSVTQDLKFVLKNEYYVDSATDRNIWINSIAYSAKVDNMTGLPNGVYAVRGATPPAEITDFSNIEQYTQPQPTAVSGDQIPETFWDGVTAFHNIPVWGNDGVSGTTVTIPLT